MLRHNCSEYQEMGEAEEGLMRGIAGCLLREVLLQKLDLLEAPPKDSDNRIRPKKRDQEA